MHQETQAGASLGRRSVLLGSAGLLAAAGAGYWVWQRRQAPAHANPRLSVQEAYQQARAGGITLIDIRTPREWRKTGIGAGAVEIDMRRDDFIAALEAALLAKGAASPDAARAAPVALICARGVRSARMTLALSNAGFSNIIDVPEGMLGSSAGPGWLAANLPVTKWDG